MSALLTLFGGGSAAAPSYTYATWNPADIGAELVLTNGDLTVAGVGGWSAVRATQGKTSGNWFYQVAVSGGPTDAMVGIGTASASLASFVGGDANGWGYYGTNGSKFNSGSNSAYGGSFGAGVTVGCRFDATNLQFYLYSGSVWLSQGVIAHGLTGTIYPMVSPYNAVSFLANFGATDFAAPAPDGSTGIFV